MIETKGMGRVKRRVGMPQVTGRSKWPRRCVTNVFSESKDDEGVNEGRDRADGAEEQVVGNRGGGLKDLV